MTLKMHDGRTVLVEVRCKTCGRLLTRLGEPSLSPDRARELFGDPEFTWNTRVTVSLCPQHGEGRPRGTVGAWLARQERAGKPIVRPVPGRPELVWTRSGVSLPWSEFRGDIEKARHTGKTQRRLL